MIEDIYEPRTRYRDELEENFAQLTEEEFDRLLKKSGVNEAENHATVTQIEKKTKEKNRLDLKRNFWLVCIIIMIVLPIVGIFMLILDLKAGNGLTKQGFIGIALMFVCTALLFGIILPLHKKYSSLVAALEAEISNLTQKAWDQMRPLNDLYPWDITTKLIQKICPQFKFDPYFTTNRLIDMKKAFGWNDDYNEERSVVYAHSGELYGNPFVFAEMKEMHWETKVYTGTKTIFWTERERGSDGKMRSVTKSQTLVATVEKPIPVFYSDKFLLFGHEAAPNLSFGREPSEHSGSGNGFFAAIGKKMELSKLRKLSRNLDDDLDFTMMNNEEFELLFHAINRDNEVEFRLLFTPLAQQQMVQLLNDKEIGYGDDFSFFKIEKMNMIRANHLDELGFQTLPERFHHYSLKDAKELFLSYNRAFFKSFYFAFAPLLTIPLYQHSRSAAETDYSYHNKASFWEHEAIANYYGDSELANPECNTETIMKTHVLEDLPDGSTKVAVHSSGFKKEPRVDYISVYGNDGRYHTVPVEWDEYLPSDRDSVLIIMEDADPQIQGDAERVRSNLDIWQCLYRNSIRYRELFACIVE